MRQAFILINDDSTKSEKIVELLQSSDITSLDNELTILTGVDGLQKQAPTKLLLTVNHDLTELHQAFATLQQIYGGELYFFVLSAQEQHKKLCLLQQCRMIAIYDDLSASSEEEQATALLVFIAKNLYA